MGERRGSARPRPGHRFLAGAPLLIAHRGGSALAPENTLPAFRRALHWWRADVLEIDVRCSRDGEVVVIHDETVDRTTNGTGRVADLPLSEIRALDAGFHFSPDGGASFPFRGQGVTIPTLREVLEAFPRARVNVELKDARSQPGTWRVIHDLAATARVLIASERRAFRSGLSDYGGPTSAAAEEVRAFWASHRLHLARACPLRVDAFQIPERSGNLRVVTPRFIRDAHTRNVPVHVWTVDEPEDMRRLLQWGVDGIVTDRPDRLARVLHEAVGRPLPPGPPPEVEPLSSAP